LGQEPIGYFNDTPYISTTDFLEELYDDEYLSKGNVWEAEMVLMRRYITKKINRFALDQKVLMNYNILGRFTRFKEYYLQKLEENL
jgi:hypothetical protein